MSSNQVCFERAKAFVEVGDKYEFQDKHWLALSRTVFELENSSNAPSDEDIKTLSKQIAKWKSFRKGSNIPSKVRTKLEAFEKCVQKPVDRFAVFLFVVFSLLTFLVGVFLFFFIP